MALVNAVQQSSSTSSDLVVVLNTVGISRMNWAPPVSSSSRLYQPLRSGPGVDDITEFYCTFFLVQHSAFSFVMIVFTGFCPRILRCIRFFYVLIILLFIIWLGWFYFKVFFFLKIYWGLRCFSLMVSV